MKIIYNESTDPYFNLALEEQLLCNSRDEYFMLWRNAPSVIIGRNQNAYAEINEDFVNANGVAVVRRLTGGGAVFHDLGNVNYTFIVNDSGRFSDYRFFCTPVIAALKEFGVNAELSGRNDMLIVGKKFSGNAQCSKNGRVMHHGTLMLCADISNISASLNVNPLKIQSKGVASVKSRVTNISEHIDSELSPEDFIKTILKNVKAQLGGEVIPLPESDKAGAEKLRAEKYSKREWNFGFNREFSIRREKKLPCGYFDARLNIADSVITELRLYGDYFVNGEITAVESAFTGVEYSPQKIKETAEKIGITEHLPGVSPEDFAAILL